VLQLSDTIGHDDLGDGLAEGCHDAVDQALPVDALSGHAGATVPLHDDQQHGRRDAGEPFHADATVRHRGRSLLLGARGRRARRVPGVCSRRRGWSRGNRTVVSTATAACLGEATLRLSARSRAFALPARVDF
jgi:hypothetical protein